MARDPHPLRVLMVLESPFPPYGGGGAESQVRTLGRALRRRGHRVTVLTPRFAGGSQRRVERVDGLPVCRLAYPHVSGLGSLVLWTRLLLFLHRRRRRYDALHAHIAHYLAALCCGAGRRLGLPTIVKFTGQWELERGLLVSQPSLATRWFKSLLRRASAYQVISRRIGREAVARGLPAELVVHLPNAVDVERFRAEHAPRPPQAPLRVVYVGRLQQHKGLDTLLRGWQRAFPQAGAAELELVGKGEDEPKLRALADQLGIAAQLSFVGHRDDVEQALAGADVAVLPSIIEGLSNSLLEFMASGLPVIASEVSGSEDFIATRRNGWLFPVGDVEALASALREAQSMPPDALCALGRQGRADVARRAGIDGVVARLLALYRGAAPGTIGDGVDAALEES
ncbi:glycosyltransferase [Dokdonella sp.]|uniref:glycosyltransferase n=1 Tax=Dokdonella sp. TaxID=2291710 RepID=UPI001B24435E|nr:glycosyltransferase [Dokdonella sp.]MBO9661985.1 glycosyltransferase [Dokdonella sp.]